MTTHRIVNVQHPCKSRVAKPKPKLKTKAKATAKRTSGLPHIRKRDVMLPIYTSVVGASLPLSTQNMRDFLSYLSVTGNATRSAAATGRHVETYHARRRRDPEFRDAWKEALDAAADELEAEARRRGVEGVDEPVVYQGAIPMVTDPVTGRQRSLTVKRYSDTLLIFLLNGARPEKYRQVHAHTGADGISPVQVDLRAAIFGKLFPDTMIPVDR